jgi:hypothetical protein
VVQVDSTSFRKRELKEPKGRENLKLQERFTTISITRKLNRRKLLYVYLFDIA